eukprot:5403430-Pleurochrysis_carterae.AAC.1
MQAICARFWGRIELTTMSTWTRMGMSSGIHASDGVARRPARRSRTPGWTSLFRRQLSAYGVMRRRRSNLRLDAKRLVLRPSKLDACREI